MVIFSYKIFSSLKKVELKGLAIGTEDKEVGEDG